MRWTSQQYEEYKARRAKQISKPWNPWTVQEDQVLIAAIKSGTIASEIAATLGRSEAGVYCRASELGITCGRSGGDPITLHRQGIKEDVSCAGCGKKFRALVKTHRKYCSVQCGAKTLSKALVARLPPKSVRELNCARCGAKFEVTRKNPNQLFCSQSCAQKDPGVCKRRIEATRANPNAIKTSYASCKRGWRIVGGKRFFARSRWEANYARFLEFQRENGLIMDWEHEPETFWFEAIKRGCRSYLPDFRVTKVHGTEYHEVKGWMNARSKTSLRRMAKYHPHIVIRIIEGKQMAQLNKTVGRFLKEWEK